MPHFNVFSKNILPLGILLLIFSCTSDRKNAPIEDRPNIIFILADDLGYGDLSCYGHPYALTPNIDNLAKEGILFEKFYASGITCCPSRTAFMTAKHPATYEKYMKTNGLGDNITVTELLKNAGYTTAHLGKWHIGPIEKNENPYGIDFIDIIDGDLNATDGKDDNVFDSAIAFIKKNKGGPFYMNIWSHISHFPLAPSQEMLAQFENLNADKTLFGKWFNQDKVQILEEKGEDFNEAMKMYLAEIYSLDVQIGRLVKSLKEQNLEENTIIIFSSDQGPSPVTVKNVRNLDNAKKRLNMVGYAGGLRGGKHNQYEGGVRIPFIVKWPKKITPNSIDHQSVVSALDFLPTLCSIAGIEINENSFDGRNKSNTWYGTAEQREEPLFWKTHANKALISILDGKWKMHQKRNGEFDLFNIEIDPFEEKEISASNTDVVESLSKKINSWNNTLPLKETIKRPNKQ